jgi:hypothetical protein
MVRQTAQVRAEDTLDNESSKDGDTWLTPSLQSGGLPRRFCLRLTIKCVRSIPRDQTLQCVQLAFDGRHGILIDPDRQSGNVESNGLHECMYLVIGCHLHGAPCRTMGSRQSVGARVWAQELLLRA